MSRPGTSRIPPRLVAFVVASCALVACNDATDPPDGPLADLDELAIYTALVDELAIFNHTAEANANLRLALGSAIPPSDPYPPELFGHTMVYDPATDAWAAESAPSVPDDVLRVTWYAVSGPFVARPVVEVGFIELTDRDDTELTRLGVRAVRTDTDATTLADYTARFGETSTGTIRTRVFEAAGMVSDGQRQLSFDTRDTQAEALESGETTIAVRLELASGTLTYRAALDEVARDESIAVTFSARVTISGVESRVDLTIEEVVGGPVNGTGTLHHGGQKIADVAVSGSGANPQWTFTAPDGSSYTSTQQRRLGDLVSILLIPLVTSANYFS